MNHKHVPRVVQDTDLVIGLKRGVTITQSQHGYGRDPNLPQGLTVNHPDQEWCADGRPFRHRVNTSLDVTHHQGWVSSPQ